MTSLRLPSQTISAVIANPSSAVLKLSRQDASFVLSRGYGHGFKCVFIVNASWTVVANIVSILLIKHHDLPGADGSHRHPDERLK